MPILFRRILKFRKICNHPCLVEEECHQTLSEENLPPDLADLTYEERGSKLAVVSSILWTLRRMGNEKIVLVSISTKVLDLLEEMCKFYGYPTLRLDGSTTASQRERVVSRFNSPYGGDQEFVLLLSSKAGGTGQAGFSRFSKNY